MQHCIIIVRFTRKKCVYVRTDMHQAWIMGKLGILGNVLLPHPLPPLSHECTRSCAHIIGLFFPFLPRQNKNRLSSTTCGEELQKISKIGKVSKDFVKKPKKSPILSDLRFWPFLTSKWHQNSNLTWSTQHSMGVPEIFNFIKISVWAPLGP